VTAAARSTAASVDLGDGPSTHHKLGLLGSLYFSQGLPFGFFTQALPVLLRKRGLSLGEIGLSSLIVWPWALKFLWAPAVDRYPRSGRRKPWIIALQLLSIVLLALLAASRALSLGQLMVAIVLVNFAAATQDIATDGLAVDLLAPSERGLANGLQVAGYRVGMIVGGGALLILADRLGSSGVFLAMGLLTGLATLPALTFHERPSRAPRTSRARAEVPFLRRRGAWQVLVLLVVYKAGDAFATGMVRPFLVDAGLGIADVGWLLGTVGFSAGLAGALGGGALVNRLGRRRALLAFGALQAAAVAGYAALAAAKPSAAQLYFTIAAEHLVGGMATAALFTCMMDWCSREASATDYTVQASAVVIASGAASAAAGWSAQALGYFGHFCLAAVLAFGGLAAVHLCFPSAEGAARIRDVAREAPPCG